MIDIMENKILEKDLAYIFDKLTESEKIKLKNANVLLTGPAGFLGFYFMQFFCKYLAKLEVKSVIALDNFILGKPEWLNLVNKEDCVKIYAFDITKDDIADIKDSVNADYIIHMASIASPTFYRKYPIETIDANIWGLRKLLDFYKNKALKGFLFFSSSEVYGDPPANFIPTDENYRGNVPTMGPRAPYDEAKRFGETLCYSYSAKFNMPIAIVRPFNNFGPGMKLNDKRVPADFAEAVFKNKDILIYSDGKPTRTFCYITDAIVGYLKALLFGKFEYFNIGIDKPEISIKKLAELYVEHGKKILGYTGKIEFEKPQEAEYLTHNPSRRCPDITKARKLLDYNPTIAVEEGVARFLEYLKGEKGQL